MGPQGISFQECGISPKVLGQGESRRMARQTHVRTLCQRGLLPTTANLLELKIALMPGNYGQKDKHTIVSTKITFRILETDKV